MKIALVLPNNSSKAPYIKYFENVLKAVSSDYDLIVWDRDGAESNAICFRANQRSGIIGRIQDYLAFTRFVRNTCNQNNYERLIIFTGQMALFLGGFLFRSYRNKYWVDIRDYSIFLKYLPRKFQKIIGNAAQCSISSPAFRNWLPKGKSYILSHNLDNQLIDKRLMEPDRGYFFKRTPLHLDTIGQIKYLEAEKELIRTFKNDPVFRLSFFGFGPALGELQEYVRKGNIENVHFYGAYGKEEESSLLFETDILNILIPKNDINGKTLLSNRIYLSALLQIPSVVYDHTAQSHVQKKYKLGFTVTSYKNLKQKVLDYRETFEPEIFIDGCRSFLLQVKEDNLTFENRLKEFIEQPK